MNKAITKNTYLIILKWLLTICGLLVYGVLLFVSYIGWTQNETIHTTLSSQLHFIFIYAIYMNGLPQIILMVYFITLANTLRTLSLGVLLIVITIPFHLYISAAISHSEASDYVPLILLEMILVFAAIFLHLRNRMTQKS